MRRRSIVATGGIMTASKDAGLPHPLLNKYRTRLAAAPTEPLSLAESQELFEALAKLDNRLQRIARISDSYQGEVKNLVSELRESVSSIKTLKGFIPICASCKKIRSDDGDWKHLVDFLSEHSEALFSHGFCPDCATNYRALAPASRTAAAVNQPQQASELNDPVIVDCLHTINNRHFADTPLLGDLTRLLQRYLRQNQRMQRIARISDSYQAQLQELNARLECAARTDPLTGLLNRQEMIARIETQHQVATHHGGTFGLILLALDHFKEVNCRYGLEAGDGVLVATAQLLRAQLKEGDSCARWGDAAFLLLLPDSDVELVRQREERLQGTLAADGGSIQLSARLGSVLQQPGESPLQILNRVERALYQTRRHNTST